jgi:hypothetical protein
MVARNDQVQEKAQVTRTKNIAMQVPKWNTKKYLGAQWF